jgi:rRNA maturation RNase YbeY
MDLVIQFEDIQPFAVDEALVALVYDRIASDYDFSIGDISVVFCCDAYILNINRTYLDHDYYTDIITFDYSEGEVLSGDLIVSVDTVASNARKYDVSYSEELFRVLIHGFLHLVGLSDKDEQDVLLMRERESFYINSCLNPFVSRETN